MKTESMGAAFVAPYSIPARDRKALEQLLGEAAPDILPILEQYVRIHRAINGLDAEARDRQGAREQINAIAKDARNLGKRLGLAASTGAALKIEHHLAGLVASPQRYVEQLAGQLAILEVAAEKAASDCLGLKPPGRGRPQDPSQELRATIRAELRKHGLPSTGKAAALLFDFLLPAAGYPEPALTAARSKPSKK